MKHPRSLCVPRLATLALLATTLYSPLALADDGSAEHAKKARVAYDLQDFPTAVQEYRAAYAAEQRPEHLFGLAQAQRQAKDYAGAIATFKSYKRAEGVTPQQATAAELLITKCEVDQAREEAAAPNQRDNGGAGAPAVNPPAGSPTAAPVITQSPPDPSATAPRGNDEPRAVGSRAFYRDALGDTLFIAGLGASAVGAAFLVIGNSKMNDSANAPTESAARSAADSAHSKQVIGAVMLPIGGALLVGGIVRWVIGSSSGETSSAGLLVGPQYVGYSGRF